MIKVRLKNTEKIYLTIKLRKSSSREPLQLISLKRGYLCIIDHLENYIITLAVTIRKSKNYF